MTIVYVPVACVVTAEAIVSFKFLLSTVDVLPISITVFLDHDLAGDDDHESSYFLSLINNI